MLLVYTEKLSPRFKYTARLLLNQLLGLEVRFTTQVDEFVQATLPKLNYSKNPMQSGLFVQSANLLFETDIFEQNPQVIVEDDLLLFFLAGKNSSMRFDPFAASFFLVTRYEEYMPFIADSHGRFSAAESFMYKHKTLHKPLVNAYARLLGTVLLQLYPGLPVKAPSYRFINSVDIDNAYAYKGKGLVRTVGAYGNDLVKLKFRKTLDRSKTLVGLRLDPFDTFDYQLQMQEKHGYHSIYFALFARLGQFDRSLSLHSARLHRFLKSVNDFCDVGIHPSYRSNSGINIVEEELHGLEGVLNHSIHQSRQHFLKLKFPETYRNLIALEITDDYSMGFAAESGFRAGICTPFRFYDLEYETETPLTVHPFPFMDGTYMYYKEMGWEEAMPEIESYVKTYKEFGGEFIPIWHNRIFSEKEPEWKGFRAVFEKTIQLAT